MKNRVLAILILTILSLPCSIKAEDDIVSHPVDTVMQDEAVIPQESVETNENHQVLSPEDMDPNSFPHKAPVSKKKIAKKFLFAMLGVGLSSFIIFAGLSLYNRIRLGFSFLNNNPEINVSLESPDNIQEAVKTFLDKTKW